MRASSLIFVILTASASFAQSFEAASIRLHQGQSQYFGFRPAGSRLTANSVSLSGLVTFAYNLRPYQLSGFSGWEDSDAWDINAKAEGDAELTFDQFRQAMRTLLASRFQLKFHRETRDLPVYALVRGKNPPKLQENNDPNAQFRMTMRSPARAVTAIFVKATMDQLANQLSNQGNRPVLNQTGLTGAYDFTLDWTPGGGNPGEPATNASENDAVEEQLGLKLEARKAPIEMFVIDHAEKPSQD